MTDPVMPQRRNGRVFPRFGAWPVSRHPGGLLARFAALGGRRFGVWPVAGRCQDSASRGEFFAGVAVPQKVPRVQIWTCAPVAAAPVAMPGGDLAPRPLSGEGGGLTLRQSGSCFWRFSVFVNSEYTMFHFMKVGIAKAKNMINGGGKYL